MNILTFTGLFPNCNEPSLGIFISQRMAHVARRGHALRVVAPVAYCPRWLKLRRWEKYRGVPGQEQVGDLTVYHPRYPLLPGLMPAHGLLMFLASFLLVRRLHQQFKFDCIDAHYVYPDGLAAVLMGRLLKIPVILSARGTDISLFPKFRLIRPMIRWTLRNTTGNIGVCTALRDGMVELGAAADRSAFIGNGIDLSRFHRVERAEARRRLALPQDKRILIAVGALISRKGLHFLIPAVAKLAPRYPDLVLYLVGEGEMRNHLEMQIAQLGERDRIQLAGSQPNEQLKYWYSAADLSCLCSSREGWANVLLESLVCGTPVVATRVWGAPEVIVSPELGVLVDQTVESIADGLEEALNRNWNREALVRYAQGRTWDVVAEEVESFFRRVLGFEAAAKSASGR